MAVFEFNMIAVCNKSIYANIEIKHENNVAYSVCYLFLFVNKGRER